MGAIVVHAAGVMLHVGGCKPSATQLPVTVRWFEIQPEGSRVSTESVRIAPNAALSSPPISVVS